MNGIIHSDTVLLRQHRTAPLISNDQQCQIIEALAEERVWQGTIGPIPVVLRRCDPEADHEGSVVCSIQRRGHSWLHLSARTVSDAIECCRREMVKSSAPFRGKRKC